VTTRNTAFIVHPAKGGLDTSTPATLLQPDQLVMANNCEYGIAGSRAKRLGTVRYNPTALAADLGGGIVNLTFAALADFWRHGTCLDANQQFIAHAGTTLYKDDGDGVWDLMDATLAWGTNGSETGITIAQGYAVFSNGVDVPKKWDQSTLSDLSSGAPYFSFSSYHLRRLWACGYASSPSSVWYTAAGAITDFTGTDTGTLLFDEDDGDRVMGLSQPWQNRLYVFKGPNNGSVWNVSGTTVNSFTKTRMFSAAPCVTHRSIVTTPDDIYWVSRHGIHSLQATDRFGDTTQALLSLPIQDTFQSLTASRLSQIVGFYHPTRNVVGWFCPEGGQNSVCLVYNYALKLWSLWRFTGLAGASCMVAITPSTRKSRLYIGGYNGYVYAADQLTKSDENADQAYSYRIRTPIHQRFSDTLTELQEKSFFCTTPDMRVLTADLRWRAAGDLLRGDLLLAFEEEQAPNRLMGGRKTVPSRVIRADRMRLPVYRIHLSDGTVLRSSGEHPWLTTYASARKQWWQTTEELAKSVAQGLRRSLVRFLNPWEQLRTYEAGYVRGIFDGEGHISFAHGRYPARSPRLGFAQNKGIVLDTCVACLDEYGIKYDARPNPRSRVTNVVIRGTWADRLAMLGKFRPERLIEKTVEALLTGRFGMRCGGIDRVRILAMAFEGEQEVVGLETSSRTYFSEGFGAHNSVTTLYRPMATSSDVTLTTYIDNILTATTSIGTKSITMTVSGDLLGSTFILGQSLLGGRGTAAYDEFVVEGRGRSIQLDWEQDIAAGDVELYGYAVRVAPGEAHAFE